MITCTKKVWIFQDLNPRTVEYSGLKIAEDLQKRLTKANFCKQSLVCLMISQTTQRNFQRLDFWYVKHFCTWYPEQRTYIKLVSYIIQGPFFPPSFLQRGLMTHSYGWDRNHNFLNRNDLCEFDNLGCCFLWGFLSIGRLNGQAVFNMLLSAYPENGALRKYLRVLDWGFELTTFENHSF